MKRRAVRAVKCRIEDVQIGDVVNRVPHAELGWFEVVEITTLFNGDFQLIDETEQQTVSGGHKDLVGVQIIEEIELDANGVIVASGGPLAPITSLDDLPPDSTSDDDEDDTDGISVDELLGAVADDAPPIGAGTASPTMADPSPVVVATPAPTPPVPTQPPAPAPTSVAAAAPERKRPF